MAEIINLRQKRKQAQRRDRETLAEQNRITHGTPKAMRIAARLEREREARDLDGKHLELPDSADSSRNGK